MVRWRRGLDHVLERETAAAALARSADLRSHCQCVFFLLILSRARDPRTKLNLERCESVRVCATDRPESRSRKVQFVREK
jgi:hypothetical protein